MSTRLKKPKEVSTRVNDYINRENTFFKKLFCLAAGFLLLTFFVLMTGGIHAIDLPKPTDVPVAPSGVTSPGGSALPNMVENYTSPAAISAISETTFPDETLAITGKDLSGAKFVVWAEGMVFLAETIRTRDNRAQAFIPRDVFSHRLISGTTGPTPSSCMLVWPRDTNGNHGRPIRVNGAEAWWMWPAYRYRDNPDTAIRVFGKNLSPDPGGVAPVLILEDEGGVTQSLTVTTHNPYEVRGDIPANLPAGTYKVFAHNGTGGQYGWSEPVTFEIREWSGSYNPGDVFLVENYSGTDQQKIEAALTAAKNNGGGQVVLAAKTYTIESTLRVRGNGVTLKGQGAPDYNPHTETVSGTGTVIAAVVSGGNWYHGQFVTIKGHRCAVRDLMLNTITNSPNRGLYIEGADFRAEDCVIITHGLGEGPINFARSGIAQTQIISCDLYTKSMGFHLGSANPHFVRMAHCRVFGSFYEGRGTGCDGAVNRGSNNVIMEHCEFQSVDKQNAKILGRTINLYRTTIRHNYLAHNTSVDMGSHPSVPDIDANTSEQYLFHKRGNFTYFSPVVTGASDRVTLSFSGAVSEGAVSNEDLCLVVVKGRGVGQVRVVDRIIAADDTTVALGLKKAWRVVPDDTSVVLFSEIFRENVVYNNFVDLEPDPSLYPAGHKRVGVYMFECCFENFVEGNTFQNMGAGVALTAYPGSTNGWNLVRGNTFKNMFAETMGTVGYPVFYTDHVRDYQKVAHYDWWLSFGNIFRDNIGHESDMNVMIGHKQFDWRDGDYWGQRPEGGVVLSIIENNITTETARPACIAPTANWALIRDNDFSSAEDQILYFQEENTFECVEMITLNVYVSDQTAIGHQNTDETIVLAAGVEEGCTATYELTSSPSNGTLIGTAPNLVYRPNTDWFGDDMFTWRAHDGDQYTEEATVSILITTQNRPPEPDDRSVTVYKNTPTGIMLTCFDYEDDPLTYTVLTQPSHGTLSGTAPDLVYTPETDFLGDDAFTFKVNDSFDDSSTATISLAVRRTQAEIDYMERLAVQTEQKAENAVNLKNEKNKRAENRLYYREKRNAYREAYYKSFGAFESAGRNNPPFWREWASFEEKTDSDQKNASLAMGITIKDSHDKQAAPPYVIQWVLKMEKPKTVRLVLDTDKGTYVVRYLPREGKISKVIKRADGRTVSIYTGVPVLDGTWKPMVRDLTVDLRSASINATIRSVKKARVLSPDGTEKTLRYGKL